MMNKYTYVLRNCPLIEDNSLYVYIRSLNMKTFTKTLDEFQHKYH